MLWQGLWRIEIWEPEQNLGPRKKLTQLALMFCFSNYCHSLSSVWCWSGEFFVRQWFDVDHGEWGERESESNRDQERENIVKILNAHAIVTVHICTVTIAIVHFCTTLHPLMWVFFYSKCVKSVTFFILHNFAHTDGDALIF